MEVVDPHSDDFVRAHDDANNAEEKGGDRSYYQNILRWGEFEVGGWKPSGRYGHNAHIVGDNLYMFGGMERSNRVNSTIVFGLKNKKWSQPTCDGTGGNLLPSKAMKNNSNDTTTTTTTTTTSKPISPSKVVPKRVEKQPLPPPRMHAASFAWGATIYIHGGESALTKNPDGSLQYNAPGIDFYLNEGDPNDAFRKQQQFVESTVLSDSRPPRTCLDDCWALDTAKQPLFWRNIPSKLSPLPRKYHTTTVAMHDMQPAVLLFGGAPSGRKQPSNALYWVRVSDLEGTEGGSTGAASSRMAVWHRAAAKGTPPCPRYGHTATRLSNANIAIFGGCTGDGELLNDIAILDTEEFTWTLITSWIGKEPAPRFGHNAVCCSSFVPGENGNPERGLADHPDEHTLIVFGGACRSGKDDEKSRKKFKQTRKRDGHVVYSHDVTAFDFVKNEWKLIKSGHTYPNARYDGTLAVSSEYGSAALLGPSEPPAPILRGVGLSPVIERDGGRYAVLMGGFNSMYVNSEPWALSMEWEIAGCGRVDQAEYELRNDDMESLVGYRYDSNIRTTRDVISKSRSTGLIQSASTPTLGAGVSAASLAPSNASTTVRFGAGTKDGFDEIGEENNPTQQHNRMNRKKKNGTFQTKKEAELGVDKEAIEKALISYKREKIIAQKAAQDEKAERIRLEEIISDLRENIANLEEIVKGLKEDLEEEGERDKTTISEQRAEIEILKELIEEQRHLMLQMDLARIEEMGINRHAQGAAIENQRHVGQDTVEEHLLVPRIKKVDIFAQADVHEISLANGEDSKSTTLSDIKMAEEKMKQTRRGEELAKYMAGKTLDDEDVVKVENESNAVLAPGDHIVASSPRKVKINSGKGEGGVSYGGGGNHLGSETARATVVPDYDQRPDSSNSNSRTVNALRNDDHNNNAKDERENNIRSNDGDNDNTVADDVNPFDDAFVNVPENTASFPIPPEQLTETDTIGDLVADFGGGSNNIMTPSSTIPCAPPQSYTARTDMSEISDSVLGTHRDHMQALYETRREEMLAGAPPVSIAPTKLRVCAAVAMQGLVRRRQAHMRMSKLRLIAKLDAQRKAEESAREVESEDEEYNELVSENESLVNDNISMRYQMQAMQQQLDAMTREKAEADLLEESGGAHHVQKEKKK